MSQINPTLRPRILIVDDSPTNVAILMDALESEYEVSFANSGKEALALIGANELPDLILLDVMMPEMDGYQVCEQLKANPHTRDVPIIFATAMDSSESESTGLALGAEDYITKPINLGIARLRIRNLLERHHLYRDLDLSMNSARQGLWSCDIESGKVTLDPRWAIPLGYAPHELGTEARTWEELVHPSDLPALHRACDASLSGKQTTISIELRMRNKHDAFVWVQLMGQVLDNGNLPPVRAIGTYLDISQRKLDEARLQAQQERVRILLASIPDIVLGFDTANQLTELHIPDTQAGLLRRPDWENQPYTEVFPSELATALDAGMLACFEDDRSHSFDCTLKQGEETRYFSTTVSRLVEQSDWPSGFMAVIRDVTEIRQAERELKELAFHDPLTGLANRRLLEDRMQQARLFTEREQSWAAIMLLDLDHFKQLNDNYGHESGDRLLIEIGRRLRATVREIDTVARLGGDEFVVVLERLGKTEAEASMHARNLANKMLAELEREYDLGQLRYRCRVSMGIRLFSGSQYQIPELLKDADAAMYRIKEERRAKEASSV